MYVLIYYVTLNSYKGCLRKFNFNLTNMSGQTQLPQRLSFHDKKEDVQWGELFNLKLEHPFPPFPSTHLG